MKFKWQLLVVALIVTAVWFLRREPADVSRGGTQAAIGSTHVSSAVTASSASSDQARAALPTEDASHDAAQGEIHFVHRAESSAAHQSSAAQLDLNVRYGLGIWLLRENVLRVLLLEQPLVDGEVARMTQAMAVTGLPVITAPTYALLELHFQSTAQAFDRNDLDAAQLIVTNSAGVSSIANVLDSLEWRGSLPARQVLDNGRAQSWLTLSSSGRDQSDGVDGWDQTWQLDVAALVSVVE